MPRRLVSVLVLLVAAPAFAQPGVTFDPDTVRAAPLDGGKMWLFEDPPTAYLEETYNFEPDAEWFEKARLAALRMRGCSASFVSPMGLVATNHHCAQGSVVSVDQGGEGLLDNGFAARSRAEERRIDDMYMDQLVEIVDVTAEVQAALEGAETDAERQAARGDVQGVIEGRLLNARAVEPGDEESPFVVQFVDLYNGGKVSAYVFRRYRDVRLVFAPEAGLGYFGGDYDNFTYPRYALDFAFMRVYGDDGLPLQTDAYFPLADEGVDEGDLVFVIGNPGRTQRALTVAQLEFLRDVELPATLAFIDSRAAALQAHLATDDVDNRDAVRSQLFGLLNSQKALGGRLRGLRDPYILARRAAAERDFRAASPEAASLIDEMEGIQAERTTFGPAYRGLVFLFNRRYGSALLRQAAAIVQGSDPTEIGSNPPSVERAYLAAELAAMQAYYAATPDAPMPKNVQGDPEANADFLLANSMLATDAEGDAADLAADPAVLLVQEVLPRRQDMITAFQAVNARQDAVAEQLGVARYAAYGNTVPPDATFSLRFTDGVVTGYPYNGTQAPPMTTLYGLFDRYYSYCVAGQTDEDVRCDWDLPERWVDARPRLDLSTPVNFTSTSDTIGGNSGSPVVNRDLELVGLNFDRTIEGLVRDYLYAPERGRNVMVDARVILHSLREVYGLPALANELTGEM